MNAGMNANPDAHANAAIDASRDGIAVPAVRCAGVGKWYADLPAVRDLDLVVADGEIMVVLGPSGCGKTTTLRLIAGFERVDAGFIDVAGVRVSGAGRRGVHVAPERRRVGMVFQDYALFPHMTVAENVAYGLQGHPDPRARASEVMGLVGLATVADRTPDRLSGGQQQRVALARALAPAPEVLLLDEPFSNLDARLRARVRDEVRDILKAAGTAAIFVTHDQEEALFMGDRVAVLNAGRLEQVGQPEEVFHSPKTRFVAEFMGESHFVPGRVLADGVETELGRLPQRPQLSEGQEVQVLVRPDDVDLTQADAGTARIRRRIFQGIHNRYAVVLASGRVVTCVTDHSIRFDPGTAVEVRFNLRHPVALFQNGTAVPSLD